MNISLNSLQCRRLIVMQAKLQKLVQDDVIDRHTNARELLDGVNATIEYYTNGILDNEVYTLPNIARPAS